MEREKGRGEEGGRLRQTHRDRQTESLFVICLVCPVNSHLRQDRQTETERQSEGGRETVMETIKKDSWRRR